MTSPLHGRLQAMDDEQIDEAGVTPPPTEEVPSPPTGHAVVYDVLGSLDALADLPVADHVAVFDRAHEGLRRALADAAQGQPPGA